MYKNRILTAVCIAISAVSLAGCPGDSARAQKWVGRTTTTARAENAQPLPPGKDHPHAARKDAGKEAFLSTYNNPDEGITFRYPRNYLLEEGEVQEHSYFLKTQEEVEAEQAGAELIVTVLIPEDAYPNTTFEHGSLQLIVRDVDSATACRAETASADGLSIRTVSALDGIRFDSTEQESSVAGANVRERHYAAFSGGQCYEFFTVLVLDQSADPDGFVKPADAGKILRQLEKIVTSVRLAPKE